MKPSSRINGSTNGKRHTLHCLITGFDAFANEPFNPTQAIVESLPQRLNFKGDDVQIIVEGLVLPTCGELAWERLKHSLEHLPKQCKSVVVLTGLASFRSTIGIERFALNIRDYRIKDNAGHLIMDEKIDPSGAEALRTTVDLEDLVKRMRRTGQIAEVSNYCGTFVCNEIYYQALSFQNERLVPHALVFLHLPPPARYGTRLRKKGTRQALKRAKGRANQLMAMKEAVLEVGRHLGQQLITGN